MADDLAAKAVSPRDATTNAALRVSIIITNWNYAGYLGACIDSALGQTRPADELIVVDDGSTDGSRPIIQSYGDRIIAVLRENGGQAAAFESGFARSTGDIIMFLDADDVLKPEAVETILSAWDSNYAGICCGMELIDREGRPGGIYPWFPGDLDHRPLLAEAAGFLFMPTSANALSRAAVAQAMPLPSKRWRISADAFLLRVAALCGRIKPLRQNLVRYRIHEGNNYHRTGTSELWRNRRDMADVADLADYFAQWRGLPEPDPEAADAFRLSELLAGMRTRVNLFKIGHAKHHVGRSLIRIAGRLVVSRAPLLPRLAAATLAAVLSTGLWRIKPIYEWIASPHLRPSIVRTLLSGLGNRALLAYLAKARTPRWRGTIGIGELVSPETDPRGGDVIGTGWSMTRYSGPPFNTAQRAICTIRLAPTPEPLSVEIEVRANHEWWERKISIDAVVNGELLTRTTVFQADRLVVPLAAGLAANGADVPVELIIRPEPDRALWTMIRDIFRLPPTVSFDSISVNRAPAGLDPASADEGMPRPFADFVGDTGDESDWVIAADGSGLLAAPSAGISLVSLPFGNGLLAGLRAAGPQPSGWLRIRSDGTEIFSGQWGDLTEIWCRIPLQELDEEVIGLDFAFQADDSSEANRVRFESVQFRYERPDLAERGDAVEGLPPVQPGQRIGFGAEELGHSCLGKGWRVDDNGGAHLATNEGLVHLLVPAAVERLTAVFEIEGGLPPPPGFKHVVVFTAEGETLQQAILQGAGEVSVSLDRVLRAGHGQRVLHVFSMLVAGGRDGEAFAADMPTQAAPLTLRGISFTGETAPAIRHAPLSTRKPGGLAEQLLAEAAPLLEGAADAALPRLRQIRAGALDAIAAMDERAIRSLLTKPGTLATLDRLGATVGPIETETSEPAGPQQETPAARLRSLLAAIASGAPAWTLPHLAVFDTVPKPFLWDVETLARYLGRAPALMPDAAQFEHYADFAQKLLEAAHRSLAGLPGDVFRALGLAVLQHFEAHLLLAHGDAPAAVADAYARACERHLVNEGAVPGLADRAASGRGKLRVGVLVQNPWGDHADIAAATAAALDDAGIEARLVVADGGMPDDDIGVAVVNLSGLSTGAAVDHVRNLDLDVVLVGEPLLGAWRLAQIAAHRLAPLQLSAVGPIGPASIDGVISWAGLEPDGASPHPGGEPIRLDGAPLGVPLPQADDGREEPNNLVRRRFGLPLDTVLLISMATLRHIGPAQLEAWIAVLARAPNASFVLLLQDDAPTAIRDAFRFRLAAALAAAQVAAERFILRGPLPGADLRLYLRVSDLYLAGFSADAGGRPLEEALAENLPGIAWRGPTSPLRRAAARLEAVGLAANAAKTIEDYVARAATLVADEASRREQRAQLRSAMAEGSGDRGAWGQSLSRALLERAGRTDLLPGMPAVTRTGIDPDDIRYLFHHMPKTAGTSTREVLKHWFRLFEDYREPWATSGFPPPVELAALGPRDLICGHFETPEMRLKLRYPSVLDNPAWRLFTIVRDPLEVALSNHHFENRFRGQYDPTFEPKPLKEWLKTSPEWYLGHFDCDPSLWREAIDRYWFIGTSERLEDSLAFIAAELGEELPGIPLINDTPRPVSPDAEDIEAFVRARPLEYEIYSTIRERLDRRLARYL